MFKNIIDFKILNLYSKDYSSSYSIREITKILNINYSHTFKRINELVKEGILTKEKKGQANNITFNIKNLEAVKLLSFVEENKKIENPIKRPNNEQISPALNNLFLISIISQRHL